MDSANLKRVGALLERILVMEERGLASFALTGFRWDRDRWMI
jgi:hypothetical protein